MERQSKVEQLSGIALNWVLVVVCLGTLVKGGYQLLISPWRGVFEPVPGIVCDTQGAFCADDQGISLPLTEQYLGRSASKALQAASVGKNAVAWPTFTLSDGMVCDSAVRQCYLDDTRKAVSSVMTENLYSRKGGHTGE
ncbi:YcgJ family protein (plasmid) [Serratia nevei]|uniref:YcgJ family protein n=1 Tax=Serratia nevei TaxID=2703794 RepID=UPI003F6C9576